MTSLRPCSTIPPMKLAIAELLHFDAVTYLAGIVQRVSRYDINITEFCNLIHDCILHTHLNLPVPPASVTGNTTAAHMPTKPNIRFDV